MVQNMNIYDFITRDEIGDLPEDATLAFAEFCEICSRRLAETIRTYDGDEPGWASISEAKLGFINVVTGAAKNFGIDEVANFHVPRVLDFEDSNYRQFKMDLDHFLTQVELENAAKAKRTSVYIDEDARGTLRAYVASLRDLIERSDIGKKKKDALLAKLAEFESELNKKRLNLIHLSVVAVALLGAPGGIFASGEAGAKLVQSIIRTVSEAKASEEEARQRAGLVEETKAISGPVHAPSKKPAPSDFSRGGDFDDEIPF